MTKEKLFCSSCKSNVTNSKGTAVFNCPNCSKQQIVRCIHCRHIATKYKCHACDFEGPN
ncbi:RNA-binding protein [Candidatus Woesearchaeota archaeon]|nr:RNA-binding protein [Candidatus Woesearchaeota archaeon]